MHHLPSKAHTKTFKIKHRQTELCGYLAFKDELEGEGALAGQVGVALRVVYTGLQHPRLVENSEARCFIVQTSDEVISAVRPELHL